MDIDKLANDFQKLSQGIFMLLVFLGLFGCVICWLLRAF